MNVQRTERYERIAAEIQYERDGLARQSAKLADQFAAESAGRYRVVDILDLAEQAAMNAAIVQVWQRFDGALEHFTQTGHDWPIIAAFEALIDEYKDRMFDDYPRNPLSRSTSVMANAAADIEAWGFKMWVYQNRKLLQSWSRALISEDGN